MLVWLWYSIGAGGGFGFWCWRWRLLLVRKFFRNEGSWQRLLPFRITRRRLFLCHFLWERPSRRPKRVWRSRHVGIRVDWSVTLGIQDPAEVLLNIKREELEIKQNKKNLMGCREQYIDIGNGGYEAVEARCSLSFTSCVRRG